MYVNGSLVTAFTSASYPSQNLNGFINQPQPHLIGQYAATGMGQFLNAYLAEMHFVPGQSLDSSSFGETDAITGRWKAKAFVGTYGTNGFYLPFTNQGTTQNLLTHSEDFSNAAWTKFQSTVTVNAAVAPNGTTTADKLIETASVGDHQLNRAYTAVDNTTYTLSAYAKAGERTVFRLYLQNKAGTYNFSDFDLVSGTIPLTSGVVPAITAVGNGWYRCSVTANAGTGATASPLAFLSYGTATAGSGTNGLFVWGAQLEASSSAGPYMVTGASAQTSTLAIGADASVSTGGYNNWVANNLSVTPGTGNDSLVDSPTNFGAISTTLVDDTYQISKSLRFNSADSAFLTRTPSVAGNRKTWTWSGWVKRAKVDTGTFYQLFGGGTGTGGNDGIFFDTTAGGVYYTHALSDSIVTTSGYRDPSTWYHIVFSVDTTQATASNRVRVYINGAEVRNFATASYPAQNADNAYINTTSQHRIGAHTNSGYYFDGYLAEVNFIDGQALTPSSFGTRDINTYLWKPKAYTGTYGTNGFYLNFSDSSNTTATTLGKDQAGSNNWTPNNFSVTAGLGNDSLVDSPTYYGTDTGVGGEARGDYATLNPLDIGPTSALANGNLDFSSSNNANYSICRSTIGVSSGKWYWEILVNSAASANAVGIANGSASLSQYLGQNANGWSYYSDGQKYNNASGTAYGSSFTTNDIIGVALDMDNGTLVFYKNNSSQGTAFTGLSGTMFAAVSDASSVSTANLICNFGQRPFAYAAPSGFKALRDYNKLPVPTGGEVRGNYATLNPLFGNIGGIITDGNLTLTHTGGANSKNALGVSSIAMSTGKWYCEFTNTAATTSDRIGIISSVNTSIVTSGNPFISQYADGYSAFVGGGTFRENNNTSSAITNFGGSSPVVNDIYMVALDLDNNKVWFGRNGSWANSGNPASGTTATYSILSGRSYYFACNTYSGDQLVANFGQRPWAYDAPFGFLPLCTTSLPQPIVQKSSTAMDVVTYTGNGATSQDITGLSFSPDLVWLKSRTDAYDHRLKDTIRGNFALFSNLTNAESGYSLDFLSNGIRPTLGFNDNINSKQYVAWAWDAGSSSVTNTSGAISSTVRANPQAGVSIVSFVNASGTNQSTVGHGLGSSPKMIIAKNRDTSANNWAVFHSSVCDTTSKFLQLNTTAALTTFATVWGASLPSSSVFGVTGGGIATASVNMIAYCFSEVEGYSKFGSYVGNGSADGPFVYCGFRPRFLMIKRTDGDAWIIKDTARSVFNGFDVEIYPASSAAEGGPYSPPIMDYVSNGFKLRSNTSASNASGFAYIFAAFAESPFKYARAR
jgi:hypothetical protein